MEKAKRREIPVVYEIHHIIPKSLGGKNTSDNLSFLTPREHFIVHALLTKMVYEKKHKRSMAYAFTKMGISNNKKGYKRIGNGRLYETIKRELSVLYSGENNPFFGDKRFTGVNNPFYGKTHSFETKQILKNQPKKYGKENHFYGKTHSKETKNIISEKQKEPVTIIFENGTRVYYNKRGDIGKSLGICKALGIQLCTIKRHLWGKYKIKEILYEDGINKKD